MASNTRRVRNATAKDVFDVLRDGWHYSDWVVGTRAIRDVDPGWPEPGTAIHYTVGRWPLRKDDRTVSLGYRPDEELLLEARAWPAGTAGIVLRARQVGDDVDVTLEEAPARGVLRLVHNPVLDLAIKLRNVETLRRFEQQLRRHQRGRLRAAPS